MPHLKISGTVALTILTVGAGLNLASSGVFGNTAKDIADYIIKGYGA